MEQTYCIYKLTNTINGKGYVGFTSDFKRRLRQHKETASKGQGQAIHAAIRKHGWENFVAEELYYSYDKQHTLDMEDHFINQHETKGTRGYNVTRGGQSGLPKGKIVPWNKGKKMGPMKPDRLAQHLEMIKQFSIDPEWRRKVSEGIKGNTNCLGRKWTEESKAKMSVSMQGNINGTFQSETTKFVKHESMKGNQRAAGHKHTEEWKQKLGRVNT